MGGSGGYRKLPGGSDHFSWQTDRHFIIMYISSSTSTWSGFHGSICGHHYISFCNSYRLQLPHIQVFLFIIYICICICLIYRSFCLCLYLYLHRLIILNSTIVSIFLVISVELSIQPMYEKVSDVAESRVWFTSKNLTPRRMHWNVFLIAQIIAKCHSFPNM